MKKFNYVIIFLVAIVCGMYTAYAQPLPGPTLLSPENNATGISIPTQFVWHHLTNAATYNIEVSDENFSVVASATGLTDTTWSDNTLIGATIYNWRVVGVRGSGQVGNWSVPWTFTTGYPPLNLISPVNNAMDIALLPTFTWENVSGALSYNLEVSTSSTFSTLVFSQNLTNTTFTPSLPLLNSTQYFWRVNFFDGSITSVWSLVWNFTTIAAPQILPPNLISPANNSSGMPLNQARLFNWSTVAGATNYNIQISINSDFTNNVIDLNVIETSYNWTDPLYTGMNYFWRVRASNGTSWSVFSSTWTFSSVLPALLLPENNVIGYSLTPTFSWQAASYSTGYNLQVSTTSNFSAIVINEAVTGTSFTPLTPLLPATQYYWRVNVNYNIPYPTSMWSNIRNFTTHTNLPAPTLLTPVNHATDIPILPTFTWDAVTGATSYNIEVSASSLFISAIINQNVIPNTFTPTTPFAQGNVYYWRVNAVDANGATSWSLVWAFTTLLPSPTLGAPVNNATGISITPTFTWSAVTNANSYKLQVSTVSTFATLSINETGLTGTSFTPSIALNQGTNYFWKMSAVNGATESVWSEIRTFKTEASGTIVSVKILFEDYWNGSTQRVTAAIVELRSGADLLASTLVSRLPGMINSNGVVNVNFTDVASGSYWLVIRHGSHLIVASTNPIDITQGMLTSYDFSSAQNQTAYNEDGNFTKLFGNVWIVKNGNSLGEAEGYIDEGDYTPTYTNFGSFNIPIEPEPLQ